MKTVLKTSENLHLLGYAQKTVFWAAHLQKKDIRLNAITYDCPALECFSALDANTMELFIYFENFGTKAEPFFHKVAVLPANYVAAFKMTKNIELVVLKFILRNNESSEAEFISLFIKEMAHHNHK